MVRSRNNNPANILSVYNRRVALPGEYVGDIAGVECVY